MKKLFLLPLVALALSCALSCAFLCACEKEGKACAHEFGEWMTKKEATCNDIGVREHVCTLCGYKESEDISALGHSFDDRYTLDIKPTTEHDGQKSRHCLHTGCAEVTDVIVIPKLPAPEPSEEEKNPDPPKDEDHQPSKPQPSEPEPTEPEPTEPEPSEPEPSKPEPSEPEPKPQQPSEADPNLIIPYRIYINRWNGYKIGRAAIKFHMEDKDGKTVYTGSAYVTPGSAEYDETEYMMCEVKLPMGEYTIHIDEAAQGLVYEESYPISYLDGRYPYKWADQYPAVDIRLRCDMDKGGDALEYGSVVKDFEIHTVNKGDVTLKGLLQDHDLVLFNFYYDGCIPCREEADAIRAIKEHTNVAVVCVNTVQAEEVVLNGVKEIFKYDTDAFYIAANITNKIFDRVVDNTKYTSRIGVPCNVFIDKYGFVCQLTGGLHTERIERIINCNTVNIRKAAGTLIEDKQKTETQTFAPVEALPSKKYI